MMTNKKALIGFVVIVIITATFIGCDDMKFNQTTNKNDLLTDKYSIAQIEELTREVGNRNITFTKFKRTFNVQCVRKTHQGYYVVLLLEDGTNAFAFFNEKDTLVRVMVSNGFKSKAEFQNLIVEQMPKSEVLIFDNNTIVTAVSAIEITVHIVQEGIIIVKYSRLKDGKITEDPIVISMEFIENERIATSEDPFIKNEIPFIFDIDKSPISN